jgi:hypothetical protein
MRLAKEHEAFESCCEEQEALLQERAANWSRATAHEAKQRAYELELKAVRVRQRAYEAEAQELLQRMPSLIVENRTTRL